jgi:hypothetical protein
VTGEMTAGDGTAGNVTAGDGLAVRKGTTFIIRAPAQLVDVPRCPALPTLCRCDVNCFSENAMSRRIKFHRVRRGRSQSLELTGGSAAAPKSQRLCGNAGRCVARVIYAEFISLRASKPVRLRQTINLI